MRRYREGESCLFTVGKTVTVPYEGENIILEDERGRKFLLPLKYYSHYDLLPGSRVRCRIDRINCNGRIFIEPENLVYKEGCSYNFTVKEEVVRTGFDGEEHNAFLIEDIFGFSYCVESLVAGGKCGNGTLNLSVRRIRRGKLVFGAFSKSEKELRVRSSERKFKVVKECLGFDNNWYYLVSDRNEEKYLVSKRHYSHYGFKPGDLISGRIRSSGNGNHFIVEPDHPFFRRNEAVVMKLTDSQFNSVNSTFTIRLEDSYGGEHFLETFSQPLSDVVKVRIVRIRKGTLSLALL